METLKKHFDKAELKSILQTFLATATVETALEFQAIVAGDFSKTALMAFLVALLRSALVALWTWLSVKKR